MDDGLVLKYTNFTNCRLLVLILVVVDDGLVLNSGKYYYHILVTVLILVVVDDGLVLMAQLEIALKLMKS